MLLFLVCHRLVMHDQNRDIYHFHAKLDTLLSKLDASEIKVVFQIERSILQVNLKSFKMANTIFISRNVWYDFLQNF